MSEDMGLPGTTPPASVDLASGANLQMSVEDYCRRLRRSADWYALEADRFHAESLRAGAIADRLYQLLREIKPGSERGPAP